MANQSIYNAFERMWQHTTAKLSEYQEIADYVNGIIVEVPSSGWTLQEDGLYTNTITVNDIAGDEMLDVNLFGEDITKEQAQAFDELVEWVDIQEGKIVLVSYSEITVDFTVVLRGKVNIPEDKLIYIGGLDFINGITLNVPVDGWVDQDDGTYKQILVLEELTGDELLDVSLYGDYTEEQAIAFDEFLIDIDVEYGKVVLTASEEITVEFDIVLRGRTEFTSSATGGSADDMNIDYSQIKFDTTENLIGDGSVGEAVGGGSVGVVSHIGMIIHTTTLDTMEKVIDIYGGTTWEKIEGMFLLGQSANYEIGSTGGEAEHTLTVDEMPSHTHLLGRSSGVGTGGGVPVANTSWADGAYTESAGGSQPHNNMPPYKTVYIWERTA